MKNEIIKNGTKVIAQIGHQGEFTVTIASYDRGWYKVECDGITYSIRGNKILEVLGTAPKKITLAGQVDKYKKGYKYSTNNAGTRSLICGDDVSVLLEGLHADDVWDTVMGQMPEVDWEAKRTKWAKLNPGQVRMCLGNMLRAKQKRDYLKQGEE